MGDLKEVRIVTNRSGKSKGFAYIEYNDEVCQNYIMLSNVKGSLF